MDYITNNNFDHELFVMCDCDSEGVRFAIDFADISRKPVISVEYFNSYFSKRDKAKQRYFQFYDFSDFKDFVSFLEKASENDCSHWFLVEPDHCLDLESENGYLFIGMRKVTKYSKKGFFKTSKKKLFEIVLKPEKIKLIVEEFKNWIDLYN